MDRLMQRCARFYDATLVPVYCLSPAGSRESLVAFSAPEWICPLSDAFCAECLRRSESAGEGRTLLLMSEGGVAFAVISLQEGKKLIAGPVFTAAGGTPPMSIYAKAQGERLCPEIGTERFISAFTLLSELCTGHDIPVGDIITVEAPQAELTPEIDSPDTSESTGHLHIGEEYEQRLYDLIESGDVERLAAAFSTPSNIPIDIMSPDPVRQQKYLFITFMTMAVRAAMRGGLPSGTAFEICHRYCLLMDSSQNIADIAGYGYNMAMSLCRGVRRSGGASAYPQLRSLIDYVNLHLYEPLTPAQLAKAAGMSVRNLSERFRREMGISPMAYVEKRRIEEAKYLLRYGKARISDIAASLQFCSQSHFALVFKKHCGISPGAYRNEIANQRKSDYSE